MKFRKKPVVVNAVKLEAFKFSDKENLMPRWLSNDPKIVWKVDDKGDISGAVLPTLEGRVSANIGDWIIRGVKGELYPCKPDIFEQTYERVEE